MKISLKKEILRKLFHLLELPVLLLYTYVRYIWDERVAILALTAMFLILLEIEYIRLEVKPKIPRILDLFRPRERNNVTGTVFFISATIIVFGAFDYQIAMLALLMTVFGDLMSALVGIRFGKHKLFKRKTAEGFLAGLAINLLIGYLFLPAFPIIFIPMAFMAAFVELMTNKIDDNITVPLFSGFTGQMIVYLFAFHLPNFPEPISWIFLLYS